MGIAIKICRGIIYMNKYISTTIISIHSVASDQPDVVG